MTCLTVVECPWHRVSTMTCLTVAECTWHRIQRVCSSCRSYNRFLLCSFLTHRRLLARVTHRVPLVEKELHILPCSYLLVFTLCHILWNFYTKDKVFVNYWKLTEFYYWFTDLVYKYNSALRNLIQKDISNPDFYCDVINKGQKFKSEISSHKVIENLIRKGYDLTTIVHSLMQVSFAKNIDNMLVQLLDPISNLKTCTFIFHSIFYYYFMFNIWFQQIGVILTLVDCTKTIHFFRCLWLIDIKSVVVFSANIWSLTKRL